MVRMGITRLGNITGLDHIGIPVAVAVRPNSRSVSVSQGKGLDMMQAMASALMEAAEGFHAEEAGPARVMCYRALATHETVIDPEILNAGRTAFDPHAEIGWMLGYDLLQREPCWLPADIVHTDYTRPFNGYFLAGSNGLASGNHPVEALIAAICELVERDSIALWQARGLHHHAASRLDLASVDAAECRTLLDRYDAAGIDVHAWNMTGDAGIPAFRCRITHTAAGDPLRLRGFQGAGCHLDPVVALARALTEAAQVRLTYIAGIRDDLLPEKYREPPDAAITQALYDALAERCAPVSFTAVAGMASDDLAQDLRRLIAALAAIGIERIVAIDLSQSEIAIPVVRVVIPGLEGDPRHPLYRRGPRARGVMAR